MAYENETLVGTWNGAGVYIGQDVRGKYRAYAMDEADRNPNFQHRNLVRIAVRDYDNVLVTGKTLEEVQTKLAELRYVLPLGKPR